MHDYHEPGGMYAPEEPQAPQNLMDPKKRRRKTYLIAIVLLVIAIIIVNAVKDEVEPSSNLVEVSDATNDVIVTIDDGTNRSEIVFDLTDFSEGFGLDAFDDLDEAGLIINSAQGKPTSGAGSESLVANVVDSEEDDMVYFATKTYDSDLQENFVGIYHYNTINNRWQRVYKDTMGADEVLSAPYLRVLARSNDYLILLKDFNDNSPGPCSNFWLLGDEGSFELMLLDITDPYAGFSTFTLPEILRQQAQNEVETCLTKM